jgi:hypothetical protein
MCFSATASFIGAGVIGSIGVATLRHVREPRTLLFASVPMLFALHQFIEGLVWLGMDGRIGPAGLHHAFMAFMVYAQGILPALMPAAVLLMEPAGRRRRIIALLTCFGLIVCAWDVYGLSVFPSRAYIDHHSIAYRNPMTGNFWISCLYILATCGSLLTSSHRLLRWYGVLNVVSLSVVEIVKSEVFASVWCVYAAVLSMMIYLQFRRGGITDATPSSRPT